MGGKCKKWRAHKPKECKDGAAAGNKREAKSDGKDSDKSKSKQRLAKKHKIAKAYVAKIEK